jgi:undecaprenyl-diphosphatase
MKALTLTRQHKDYGPNILDNLRTIGFLARWPLIGVAMFLIGGLIFGALAYNVTSNGPLIQTDTQVANATHAEALSIPKVLINVFIFGSFLGREMIVMIGLALSLYFLYKRFWRELFMVLIGLGGEEILFETFSRLFHRHRPVFARPVWEVLPGPGFPSGHSASAILCYGLLAYLLVPKMPTRFWKAVIIILALFIMAYIGFSRVFVGDHYLTDVLAGYGMGLAWAGLIYTLVEKLFKFRIKSSTTGKNV